MQKPRRILLKLSGESLSGEAGFGFDDQACHAIAQEVAECYQMGIQIGIVIGGGNIFRGQEQASRFGFKRVAADYVGLLATTLNSMILAQLLETKGCKVLVLGSKEIEGIVDSYRWSEVDRSLNAGFIIVFAGGTGNPFFTTDSAAALRACEMEAEVLLKGTKVDGIYDKDPKKDASAIRFEHLTYDQALQLGLKVMDATAISLCKDQSLPIIVFDLFKQGALKSLLQGQKIGTLVS